MNLALLTPRERHMADIGLIALRQMLFVHDDVLYWKWRSDVKKQTWNTRYAGKIAGCNSADGYRMVSICNRLYRAHRIIWALHYGEWPKGDIDHINGIRDDNRIINLRVVTNQENHRNMPMQRNNTSGHIGVFWNKQKNKWHACIKIDGKNKHLGLFAEKAEAIAARRAASVQYGFHANHGRAIGVQRIRKSIKDRPQ